MSGRNVLGLCLLCLTVAGCGQIDAIGLKKDLEEICRRFSPDLTNLRCEMVGRTRTGFCAVSLSEAGTESLIQRLHLSKLGSDTKDVETSDVGAQEFEGGCRRDRRFGDSTKSDAHWIHNRPDALRLPDGGAFQYLLLFRNRETGDVCIQVSYSYG